LEVIVDDRPFTHHSFQQFLDEGRLMGARCEACGETFVPPRPLCPHCHDDRMAWTPLSGQGKLAAYTTVHIGPKAMIAAGYDRNNPYCAGIVKLAEGPFVSAQIVGVDAGNPAAITIGTPLTFVSLERGAGDEQHTVLAFGA
jgi:uncharacterized OB-fold protein